MLLLSTSHSHEYFKLPLRDAPPALATMAMASTVTLLSRQMTSAGDEDVTASQAVSRTWPVGGSPPPSPALACALCLPSPLPEAAPKIQP